MNQDQVLSIVRSVLKIGGTLLVAYGYVSDQQWITITSAVIAVAPMVWDMYVHTKQAKLAAVAAMPEVKGIVTTSTVAAETPSPKVVASAAQIPAS
jgi:hypothetical protein